MKILAAVDGSDASIRTIRFVSENPWLPGTIVRVVAVADKVHPSIAELVGSGGTVQDSQHASRNTAARLRLRLRHSCDTPGSPPNLPFLQGVQSLRSWKKPRGGMRT